MRFPDEPTTQEQWQVIVWGLILVLAVIGGVGMYYSFGAPAAKAELAEPVRWYSLAIWGLAAVIYVIKRIIERILQ